MKLAAIFVLALVGIAVAQSVAPIPREVRLVGEIPASWWTYTLLSSQPDGTPVNTYVVPADRYFVVTLSSYTSSGVLADGVSADALLATRAGSFDFTNGTRATFQPGTLLTASAGGGAQLWGYLEPVR